MFIFDIIRKILLSEKEFTKTNYKRLKKTSVYIKNIKQTIEINNSIVGSNNIALRKVYIKP